MAKMWEKIQGVKYEQSQSHRTMQVISNNNTCIIDEVTMTPVNKSSEHHLVVICNSQLTKHIFSSLSQTPVQIQSLICHKFAQVSWQLMAVNEHANTRNSHEIDVCATVFNALSDVQNTI